VKILVVGGGGREHALAWKLKQSSSVDRIFCAPGNAGTAQLVENIPVPANDLLALLQFAKQNRVDFTIVGPDDPLANGIADIFAAEGLRIFGPTRSAARVESSKIFAKELMRRIGIPTAHGSTFERSDQALRFCERVNYPIVIKADGLALGKGVIIAGDVQSASNAIEQMMEREQFGQAGRRIVIEEFLRGRECSVHALVDGRNYRMLATARDHKRVFDGDEGLNTGGMGAVSPADTWTPQIEAEFEAGIMKPLLRGLQADGVLFRGLLFPGLMVTADGPRVLEFNCRFGDPETQAILPRLISDLLPLLEGTAAGELDNEKIEWDERVAVTVVLASGGYPDRYETGKRISGLDEAAKLPGVEIFHAGTREVNGEIVTAGGRVLAVTALGATTEAAREQAYAAVALVDFEGRHYRHDIALTPSTAKLDRARSNI
jgi:phosphoribosylamine--glycine ligase